MPSVFVLTGPRKGQTVKLGSYQFSEGAMIVSDEDAIKMAANMEFYAARKVPLEVYEEARAKKITAESKPEVKPGK